MEREPEIFSKGKVLRGGILIFVTVGTHRQQFNRLIQKIDELIGEGKIKEEVFIQKGNSTYEPKKCRYKEFLQPKEFQEKIRMASIVITHGGAGAIISSLKQEKAVIVVPRLEKYGEHTNDHQIDLAVALEKRGKVIGCIELKELEEKINIVKKFKPKKQEKTGMINALNEFLGEGN